MGTTKGACGAGAEEAADELGERVAARGFVTREDFLDALRAAEQRGIKKAADFLDAEAATQTGYGDLGDYAEDLAHQVRAFLSGNATDRSPTDSSVFGSSGCAGGSHGEGE